MSNSTMPNLPGFGAIAETMELVRNMWGGASAPGLGIPGMVMPTLSVEEINKQISDLKAVESWLTLNMNMLRGTIQALEVQSATISTLRSMGESLNAAIKPAAAVKPAGPESSYPFMRAPTAPAPAPAPAAEAAPAPPAPAEAAPAPQAEQSAPGKKADAADTGFGTPLANPAAWWNLLQDQFKQAVGTAMTPETNGAAKTARASAGATPGTAARPAAKAVTKKTAAAKKPVEKTGAKTAAKSPARQR